MVIKKVDIRTNRWSVVFCTFVSSLQNGLRELAGTILWRRMSRASLQERFCVGELAAQTCAELSPSVNGPRKPARTVFCWGIGRASMREAFTVLEWFAQLRFIPFAFCKPRSSGCLRFCSVVIAVLSSIFAQTCFLQIYFTWEDKNRIM